YKYVPRTLIERPKKGFGVPIDQWLRGPLRDWAENLLNSDRLRREGFLNPRIVTLKWSEHLSGKRNWQYYLWDVLMFQAWLEAEKHCPKRSVSGSPSPLPSPPGRGRSGRRHCHPHEGRGHARHPQPALVLLGSVGVAGLD